MSDLAIKVENLSKTFKISKHKSNTLKDFFLHPVKSRKKVKFQALNNINFEIKKGEWIGIIGKNGSGKSTLLKILAGVYQADEGKIQVNGKVIPFLELGVGFNLELTARENIYLNGVILGLTKEQLEKKFDEIVDFAEIGNFLETPVKNFSSGMKVRLAFAIAMQADGDIYLLDEVLAVGDLAFQRKSMNHLMTLKRAGKTILFVSHSQEDIKNFCEKVILLEKSEIKVQGKSSDVVNEYNLSTSKAQSLSIKSENKNLELVRWGTGAVQITSVKLMNKNYEEINLVKHGEEIIFRFYYKIIKSVDELKLGIGIYREDDVYCLGVNTEMDNVTLKINEVKESSIDLCLQEVPFFAGKYYINVVAFGYNEKDAYDWIGNYLNFIVTSDLDYRGLVNIKHNWEVKNNV